MTTTPADLRDRLRYSLPMAGSQRVMTTITPRDPEHRKCPAWCADHFEVQAYYQSSDVDLYDQLQAALDSMPGVYMTTRAVGASRENPDAVFSNPEWPDTLGARRRGRKDLRRQVIALYRDPTETEPRSEIVSPTTDVVASAEKTTTAYRDAATTLWGDAGAYVHDSYDRHRHLFPELPDTLPIVIGITAYGRCLGATRTEWGHGPRITIASNLFKGGTQLVDDVMVHEMLHAWLHVTGRDISHDSDDWYDAINRLSPVVIGRSLDLKRGAHRKSVRVTIDGKSTVRKELVPGMESQHQDAATWPTPFQPKGRDKGRRIPCPSY